MPGAAVRVERDRDSASRSDSMAPTTAGCGGAATRLACRVDPRRGRLADAAQTMALLLLGGPRPPRTTSTAIGSVDVVRDRRAGPSDHVARERSGGPPHRARCWRLPPGIPAPIRGSRDTGFPVLRVADRFTSRRNRLCAWPGKPPKRHFTPWRRPPPRLGGGGRGGAASSGKRGDGEPTGSVSGGTTARTCRRWSGSTCWRGSRGARGARWWRAACSGRLPGRCCAVGRPKS